MIDFSFHTFVERCLRNHDIKFGGELMPPELKNGNFIHPPTDKYGGQIVKGIPMKSLLGKPSSYNLYT